MNYFPTDNFCTDWLHLGSTSRTKLVFITERIDENLLYRNIAELFLQGRFCLLGFCITLNFNIFSFNWFGFFLRFDA